ncbi:hypothetical protein MMC31_003397 [Peltigera leucophlebia]|nr:hypothetical protein [Peltigera leucophlebia]
MPTSWTRVAQTRSTRICSSLTNATRARPTTTTTSRNRLGINPVSTFVYSAILATAAIVDSARKDERRKKLDRAIEEANNDLKALEQQQQRRLARLSLSRSRVDDISKLVVEGHWFWEDVFQWADQEIRTRERLGFQDWQGIRLSVLETLSTSEVEETLRHDGLLAYKADPPDGLISLKKLKTLEWSVAKLAYRILQLLSTDKTARESQPSESSVGRMKLDFGIEIKQANRRLTELSLLSQGRYDFEMFASPQAPRYTSNPCASPITQHAGSGAIIHPESVALLNRSLRELFHGFQPNEDKIFNLIINVCHRLLVSKAPPDVHTFTLLVTQFSSFQRFDLVKIILASVADSHIRPDQGLLSAMLDFYTATDDIEGFRKLVSQMRGFSGGLMLAHPDKRITRATLDQYRFFSRKGSHYYNATSNQDSRKRVDLFTEKAYGIKFDRNVRAIVQKPPKDEKVYEALLRGAVSFFGDKQAMINYISMISEGLQPTLSALTSILQCCCYYKDWLVGKLVWHKIHQLAQGPDKSAYFWMLRLCQRCHKQVPFRDLLLEGVKRNVLSGGVYEFRQHIKHLDVEALWTAVRKRAKIHHPPPMTTLAEKREWFEASLRVIGEKMASSARRFGYIQPKMSRAEAIGHSLSSRVLALFENEGIQGLGRCGMRMDDNSNDKRQSQPGDRYGKDFQLPTSLAYDFLALPPTSVSVSLLSLRS